MSTWAPVVLGAVRIDRATEREVRRTTPDQLVTVRCHTCTTGPTVGRVVDPDAPTVEAWAPSLAPRSPDARGVYWTLLAGPLPDEGTVPFRCFRCAGHGVVDAAALARAVERASPGAPRRVPTRPLSAEVR